MQYLGYLALRLLVLLFWLIPYRALYVLSDGLAFVLYRLVGYRKQVIFDNLRRAFPEKTEVEIRGMMPAMYRNLTDLALESIKMNSTSVAEITRRGPVRNPELVNKYLDAGQSIILSAAHLNSWEVAGITLPPAFHGVTRCAYKPMSNKYIDAYTNRMRSRTGMVMMSMVDTFGTMRRNRGETAVYILLADQSPSNAKSAHWVTFFGTETAALPGVDVLARSLKYPVLYFGTRRLRRGFYEVILREIWTDPTVASETDITKAYTAFIEKEILAQPEGWLWSHRRWKIVRSEK